MDKAVGKNVPLSPFRRLVTDLMHFSRGVPAVTVERRMELAELVAVRQACCPRPSWVAIFGKAFALATRNHPESRQSYLTLPAPRLYEHPHHIAAINVEREHQGERVVLFCLVRGPENRSLAEIEALVRHHREAPLEQLHAYGRMVAMGSIPWPFRRLFWWLSINLFGRRRCHSFGTFSLSSVASRGAGLLTVLPLLTSSVHYGMFDEESRLDVRLTWDHRVYDGATAARVLVDMENILRGQILAELRPLSLPRAA